MIQVHLFCNPFFDGYIFWKDVQQRISTSPKHACSIHNISDIVTIDRWIEKFLISSDAKQHIIVAHGSATPFVADIAQNILPHKDHVPISFVLSNGPLLGVDIIQQSYTKLPKMIQYLLVISPFSKRFLSSSLAFRRLVINPYVMNSDMIVALCSPVFSNRQKTQNCIDYINKYNDSFPIDIPHDFPTLLCWGTMDVRYPMTSLTSFETQRNHIQRKDIEGGQHFHPLERPWAIADEITSWVQ